MYVCFHHFSCNIPKQNYHCNKLTKNWNYRTTAPVSTIKLLFLCWKTETNITVLWNSYCYILNLPLLLSWNTVVKSWNWYHSILTFPHRCIMKLLFLYCKTAVAYYCFMKQLLLHREPTTDLIMERLESWNCHQFWNFHHCIMKLLFVL